MSHLIKDGDYFELNRNLDAVQTLLGERNGEPVSNRTEKASIRKLKLQLQWLQTTYFNHSPNSLSDKWAQP